ncbi:OmpA/MotB family protein [Azospirillum lipoferum]|uniref:Flagellar motor protein MotB-like n=1 Tax=Azospirillum lipoferum (strain 4B) TaxID=862719 RepID=G7ZES5_AZOL4|nr:OmpA family protein [Azospirillum lipoferum]CBS90345.1 putative Flagellar motor protein MotB-like [Azospirillum lipoferum 4B]
MAPRDDRPANGGLAPDDAEDLASPTWAAGIATGNVLPQAGAEEDQEIWLLSYSDLVTLLLSVFVMLLAITSLKDQLPTTPQPETPALSQPVTLPAPLPIPPLFDEPAPQAEPAPAADAVPADPRPRLDDGEVAVTAPDRVAERWRETLAGLGVPRSVAVDVRQNRVGIVIGEGILFAPGQAELTPGGDGLLRRLAPTLAATRGDIVVEGHSDSTPIGNRRFPSNWELSGGRAASVVRRLIELGLAPDRLSAVGFADTRPLSTGTDPVSMARNRRVAITIQADGLPDELPAGQEPARAIP